jgi:hypothetical protein
MAIIPLILQKITRAGIEPQAVSANADGNTFKNTHSCTMFSVYNASGAPITVTFVSTVADNGLELEDRTAIVPAGKVRSFGPFPIRVYGDPVTVHYSSVTDLTVGSYELR